MPNGTDTTNISGTTCAPCTYAPKYFASQVLPDGRVVVIGGEYNTNSSATNPASGVWTNIGFLFDPTTNGGMGSWSTQLTAPATFTGTNGVGTEGVGDAQSIVLPNGTMLLATTSGTDLASFNSTTLTFTALNPTNKLDSNDQENWNILPNGRILTVDSRTVSSFEIYDPVANSWGVPTDVIGNPIATPVNLADVTSTGGGSKEVGPAVLRPDGGLIYFSGNFAGQNAVYDTATGNWTHTAQMDFPCLPAGPGMSAILRRRWACLLVA
ncbi:MAG: hypothetical protein ABJB61_01560 [bacterium]